MATPSVIASQPPPSNPNSAPASNPTAVPPNGANQQMTMHERVAQTLNAARQINARYQALLAQGHTPETSQEVVDLLNQLRQFQAWKDKMAAKMQQQQQQQQQQQLHQQQQGQAQGQSGTSSGQATAPTAAAGVVPSATASGLLNGVGEASTTSQAQPTASTSSVTSTATTAAVPRTNSPALVNFSQEQLANLKCQIFAYRMLSRNMPINPVLQKAVNDPKEALTLVRNGDRLGPSGMAQLIGMPGIPAAGTQPAVADGKDAVPSDPTKPIPSTSNVNGPVAQPKVEPTPAPQPMEEDEDVDDPSSLIYPYNAFTSPQDILRNGASTIAPAPVPRNALHNQPSANRLIPSLLPSGWDPNALLEERERFISKRVEWRMKELEGMDMTKLGGDRIGAKFGPPRKESEPIPSGQRLKALIELKSLNLLAKQKALREQVVRGLTQASSLSLVQDRKAVRREKRQVLRDARMTEHLERVQKNERDSRMKQKHRDHLATITKHAAELQLAHRTEQSRASRLGKAVLKFHQDAEKEEQKRVERLSKERLRALKDNDEEAYMKLIDTAKDTRITHLLRQTDTYLEDLANKVLAKQESAASSRRAKGTTLEGHTDESSFGAAPVFQDENSVAAKQDYYNVTHRRKEIITEQPRMLTGGKLKDYQIKGLQWMVSLYNNNLNGILADEMGLGKTIQTISLVTYLIESKGDDGPFIIIVPLSTISNWTNEFQKWAPEVRCLTYKGSPAVRKQLADQLMRGRFHCVLTTFEFIIRDKNALSKKAWQHMIIDEGHRMKNDKSKLSMTLNTFYKTENRLILTGTPLQNNLPELWALLNFILPDVFNSASTFDEWFNAPFANTGGGDRMELNEEESLLVIRRLHKVLRPFLLRRLKKDVESELPDKVENIIRCKMSSLQQKVYKQIKDHGFLFADGAADAKGPKRMNRSTQNKVMQLKKVCNHPFVFPEVEKVVNPLQKTDSMIYRSAGKFELLDRVLPKLFRCKHRILMFFQMTTVMTIMEDYLTFRGIKCLRLDGTTKTEDRGRLLELFNDKNSEFSIFLLSTRAGGLGLNLQTADTVIIFDSDWNPHQDLQAQDRAHRIGQKQEVRILRLVTEKSVEEAVLATAGRKIEMDRKVIQGGRFDHKSSAKEQEEYLMKLLEEENDFQQAEEGDMTDDELNELLARNDEELAIYKQIDEDRTKLELQVWRQNGNKGPAPPRLVHEDELPELYQQDYPVKNDLEEEANEDIGRRPRQRNPVHYDDGLTEEQFLQALEDEKDITEIVNTKRQRKEKRLENKLKRQALAEAEHDSPAPSEGGSGSRSRARSKVIQDSESEQEATPEPAPTKGRKRGRPSTLAASASPALSQADDDVRPQKRAKGAADDGRTAIKKAFNALLAAVEAPEHPDHQVKCCSLFLDLVDRNEYPDYYQLITKPIAIKQIKRNMSKGVYHNLDDVRRDFTLMFDNARIYNQEGSFVYVCADIMQDKFEERLSEIVREQPNIPGAKAILDSPITVLARGQNGASANGVKDSGDDEGEDNDGEEVDEDDVPGLANGARKGAKENGHGDDDDSD